MIKVNEEDDTNMNKEDEEEDKNENEKEADKIIKMLNIKRDVKSQ